MDAIDEGVGGESAEDDGVRRADTGAGEHGDGQFRRHAHVDSDAVTFFHAKRFQDVGELLYFEMQLLIGEGANFAGFTLPNDRGLVFAVGGDVTIKAVVGEIDLAAHEPFGPGAIPLEDLIPLFEPVELAVDARPKLVWVVYGFLVQALVIAETLDVGLGGELGRTLELTLLLNDGINASGLRVSNSFLSHVNLDAEEIYFSRRIWRHGFEKSIFTQLAAECDSDHNC